jgi:tRNA (cytidine32/uridine32-2'-O)-methyltransferase
MATGALIARPPFAQIYGVAMTAEQNQLFSKIRIVLVETSHPGNIGAAARAMKNMGLSRLYLVNPVNFPHEKALFRAASARDVVENAVVCTDLSEAIGPCQLVLGTSARQRRIPWPLVTPKQAAQKVTAQGDVEGDIAIVFGRESKGLKNEELQQCQLHLNIPTSDEYSSLNLAMAVQVVGYEIFCAAVDQPASPAWDQPPATNAELEHFFEHLEDTLAVVGFHDPENPRQLMTRLRRLFLRIAPDHMEISILRGFLKAVNDLKSKGANV